MPTARIVFCTSLAAFNLQILVPPGSTLPFFFPQLDVKPQAVSAGRRRPRRESVHGYCRGHWMHLQHPHLPIIDLEAFDLMEGLLMRRRQAGACRAG